MTGRSDTGIYLGTLDKSAPTRLTASDGASTGAYLPSGWMLWVRESTLVAQRLDVAQASLTGEPVTVAGAESQPCRCRRRGWWPMGALRAANGN